MPWSWSAGVSLFPSFFSLSWLSPALLHHSVFFFFDSLLFMCLALGALVPCCACACVFLLFSCCARDFFLSRQQQLVSLLESASAQGYQSLPAPSSGGGAAAALPRAVVQGALQAMQVQHWPPEHQEVRQQVERACLCAAQWRIERRQREERDAASKSRDGRPRALPLLPDLPSDEEEPLRVARLLHHFFRLGGTLTRAAVAGRRESRFVRGEFTSQEPIRHTTMR